MPEGTDRCPLCDQNILLPFRKRISQTESETVILCANPKCNAMFLPVSSNSMQLISCEMGDALEKYRAPLTLDEWYQVWKQTHARSV